MFWVMDIRAAKVPFVLYAGNSHPELAKLIAEYVLKSSNICILTQINADLAYATIVNTGIPSVHVVVYRHRRASTRHTAGQWPRAVLSA